MNDDDPTWKHETVASDGSGRLSGNREASPPPGPIPPNSWVFEKPGDLIGPYKILEQIGEGGFGVVYLAEQTEGVKRKVALKIIKPGMDSKEVIARFEAERQALALMDHRGIANVYDAGATPTGRPFFVMEWIRGVPVTEYCNAHRLNFRQRLELVREICSAVQHAHQKGIIHRDLKPSNILVPHDDDHRTVKIIDFGIAKSLGPELTQKTLFTLQEQLIGTPQYMSPEQSGLSGFDIDTRCDIYSVGVITYELLVGRPPFEMKELRAAGFEEMLRIIREKQPPLPSIRLSRLNPQEGTEIAAAHSFPIEKLTRQIQGELDWIVMKAIEKERGRRYSTISDFGADIDRYLNGDPVSASPPSKIYRIKKFATKQKGPISAVVLVILALIAGLVTTLIQANRAKKASELANRWAVRMEQKGYFSDMRQAAASMQSPGSGGIGAIEKIVSLWHPPSPFISVDHRNWEWYFLRALTLQSLETIHDHGSKGEVFVVISPDGSRFASNSDDRIVIRDMKSKNVLITIDHDESNVGSMVVWSADGEKVAAATGFYQTIKVWNSRTGKELAKVPCETNEHFFAIALKPDGDQLVTRGDGGIKVWSSEGEFVEVLSDAKSYFGRGSVIAWDWEFGFAANLSDRRLMIVHPWDQRTATYIDTDQFDITSLSWSHLHTNVILAGTKNGEVTIWDASTKKLISSLRGHVGAVNVVACCPTGFATGGEDGTIRLWINIDEEVTFYAHPSGVASISWDPEGKYFVSGGKNGELRLWDRNNAGLRTFHSQIHLSETNALAWKSDSSRLASLGLKKIRILDPKNGRIVADLDEPYSGSLSQKEKDWWDQFVSISWVNHPQDGQLLTARTRGGAITGWRQSKDSPDGWEEPTEMLKIPYSALFSISSDASHAAAYSEGMVFIGAIDLKHDTRNFLDVKKKRQTDPIILLESDPLSRSRPLSKPHPISGPDPFGGAVAAPGSDPFGGAVGVPGADPFGGAVAAPGPDPSGGAVDDPFVDPPPPTSPGEVRHILWSPDSSHLAVFRDYEARIYLAENGNNTARWAHRLTNLWKTITTNESSIQWNPRKLEIAMVADHKIQIVDAKTGKMGTRIDLAPGVSESFSWNAKGTRIVTAGAGNNVTIWDASNGTEIMSLPGHQSKVVEVDWSPDGLMIATKEEDGAIKIWDATLGYQLDLEKTERRSHSLKERLKTSRISTVDFSNISLEEALSRLESAIQADGSYYDYGLEVKMELSESAKKYSKEPITLRLTNVSLGEVLRYVTNLAQTKYRIAGNRILILSLEEAD